MVEGQGRRGLLVSKGWVQAVALVVLFGFFVLGLLAYQAYTGQPPIPERVVDPQGNVVFTGEDVIAGQGVFLKNGLMQYGSIFGHGAYLGPDFTADYLRRSALFVRESYGGEGSDRSAALTISDFKENRYDPGTRTLEFTAPQAAAFEELRGHYGRYFGEPTTKYGLRPEAIKDPEDVRRLTAYFAWTAWAASVLRPETDYTYTNNWPPEPLVENEPTANVVVWSVLSLIALVVLPGHGRAIVGTDDGRGGVAALPGGSGQLLRHRSRAVSAVQPHAHLARAAGDLLGGDLLPGGGHLPRPADRRQGAARPAPPSLRALGCSGHSRLREPHRGVDRDLRLDGRPLGLVRQPGFRISGPGALLADPALGRPLLLGRDAVSGDARAAAARAHGQHALAVLLRRSGHPGLLCRRSARPARIPLHDRGLLAVLGRAPLGGGLPRALYHRHGRLHLRFARGGARKGGSDRHLPGHIAVFGGGCDRDHAPPLLFGHPSRAHGPGRILLGGRGHPPDFPDG